jgi:hypothetical protein
METPDTSSATFDTTEFARELEQAAAQEAHTIGHYTADVHQKSALLMKAGGQMQEVAQKLQENARGVEKATQGGMSIKVDTLDPGVNGYTVIGGSDNTIVVSEDLLTRMTTLEEVVMHERRHNKQVELETGGQEVILITASGQEVTDSTVVYEGDTETHTATKFGRRTDQPQEVYGEGHDIADEVQKQHGEEWNTVLTDTGDVGELQRSMWQQQMEDGSMDVTMLMEQAQKTRYEQEAAQVLSAYVKNGHKMLAA